MLKRTSLLVVALAILLICSTCSQRLDAQLVGYWNFDGSVEDLSGLENHGQLFDAQYSDNVPSVLGDGQSLDFSEESHHVFIEANDSLNSSTFTLAMFTYDRGQVGALERLTSREGDSFETAINVHGPFEGMGEYAFFPGEGGWKWNDKVPTLEQWQHVAYVATEADTMQIYVDGELTFEDPWNGSPSGFMHIGNRHNNVEGFDGLIDNVALWNEALDADAIRDLAGGGNVLDGVELLASPVGPRGAIGSNLLEAVRANQVFSEPSEATLPGLGQSWYAIGSAGTKTGVEATFQVNERSVPYFQADSEVTWWSGSDDVLDVPKYPSEVEGVITGDNYTVKLEGEILIEESGPIRFLDGVDDYAYLAIDVDRSGVAGDSEEEVLINDSTWTNAVSIANGGAPIVEVDFENVENGGEWLAIEFNMTEGGGGDHGMLYWDALDDEDLFPIEQGEGIAFEEDAAILMIPDTHLRSPAEPAQVVGGDAVGTVPTRQAGWEIDVNPADGTSDTFTVDNPDENVLSSIVDLDGVVFTINPLGEVAAGSSFRIVDADSVIGTPTIATEGWAFDLASGSLVFGATCNSNSQGDLDGNGIVEFADFLALSANFGQDVSDHTSGDIDCNGKVEFADFLVLSGNFGANVGATESVPEPTALGLMSFGLFGIGLLRRRRK